MNEQNFLDNIDIFGIGINIRFSQRAEHRTKIGGIITTIIVLLMAYQIKLVVDNFTDSKNPTVLFEQRFTKQPERFDLNHDKFSLMFYLQDPKSQHYIDPSIYKVTLWLKKTKKVLDQQTGDYLTQWDNRVVNIEPCTPEHFQVEAAKEYFLKLKYTSMYCISLKEIDIYIEGQFDAQAYAGLDFIVESCTGDNCQTPDKLQSLLNNGRFAIYYTDNAVVPSDKENPFQPLGKQSFWVSGPQFTKSLNISVRNTYLQTDNGFITQDIHEDRTLTWSFDREQTTPKVENVLYDCYLSFEKNINSVYRRSYPKFDRALSQIGGAFNVLFAFGCLICRPLSQIELNRKLINSIFNFEDEKDDENKNDLNSSKDKSVNQEINLDEVKEIDTPVNNQTHAKSQYNRQQSNHSHTIHKNFTQSFKLSESLNEKSSHNNSKFDTKNQSRSKRSNSQKNQTEQQSKDLEKLFQQQTNSLKFKRYEYFINFFKFSNFCRNRKQRLLQKGVDKLYNHIDIFYLVNKLLEVEKLKHLLLNEDQIKLFEFIPKPTLTYKDKKPQSVSDRVGLVEKTADAQESFKKICKKGDYVSKIDLRLLELLDPRFKQFLTELDNQSDVNTSKMITAVESKMKIKLLPFEDNILGLQIPLENSTTEQNQTTNGVDNSVCKLMFSYLNKNPNQNDIQKLDQS